MKIKRIDPYIRPLFGDGALSLAKIPPMYPVMGCFIERAIQSVKFELTRHIRVRDGDELQKYLDEYQLWFNNYRPQQAIGGLTPSDFSNGKVHPKPISIAELKQKKLKRVTLPRFYLEYR